MTNNDAILKVLKHFDNSRKKMAESLGVSLYTIHRWIRENDVVNERVAQYIEDNIDCDVTYNDLIHSNVKLLVEKDIEELLYRLYDYFYSFKTSFVTKFSKLEKNQIYCIKVNNFLRKDGSVDNYELIFSIFYDNKKYHTLKFEFKKLFSRIASYRQKQKTISISERVDNDYKSIHNFKDCCNFNTYLSYSFSNFICREMLNLFGITGESALASIFMLYTKKAMARNLTLLIERERERKINKSFDISKTINTK